MGGWGERRALASHWLALLRTPRPKAGAGAGVRTDRSRASPQARVPKARALRERDGRWPWPGFVLAGREHLPRPLCHWRALLRTPRPKAGAGVRTDRSRARKAPLPNPPLLRKGGSRSTAIAPCSSPCAAGDPLRRRSAPPLAQQGEVGRGLREVEAGDHVVANAAHVDRRRLPDPESPAREKPRPARQHHDAPRRRELGFPQLAPLAFSHAGR